LLTVLELAGTLERIGEADQLIVGDGSLDRQSLFGKGPVALASYAREHGTRVYAVVGRSSIGGDEALRAGLTRVYTLVDRNPDVAECMETAPALLLEVGRDLGRALRSSCD
jgi:glycerate kinase